MVVQIDVGRLEALQRPLKGNGNVIQVRASTGSLAGNLFLPFVGITELGCEEKVLAQIGIALNPFTKKDLRYRSQQDQQTMDVQIARTNSQLP